MCYVRTRRPNQIIAVNAFPQRVVSLGAMTLLRTAMAVFFAASIQAQPADAPPSAAELREWVDAGSVNSGKRIGIDYRGALESAIRQEPAGLAELFRYTVIGEMDGAAGEAHSAILLGLLQRWGDKQFAHVLRAQKREIRKAVLDTLPLPQGRFPLTSALAAH